MVYLQGLEKKLNLNLPLLQAALKFCFPWASFSFLSFKLSLQLAWALAYLASENKKFLAWQ